MPRKTRALTARQREVYEYIKRTIKAKGYCPTVREIGDAVSINSPNGVIGHLRALIRKGYIVRQAHMARSIQLANQKDSGSISIGSAIENNQFISTEKAAPAVLEEVIPVSGTVQLVTVKDNTFNDAKIVAGDVIVVRTDIPASEGQTVLATAKTGKLSLIKWGADAVKKIGLNDGADSTKCEAVVGIALGVMRKF